MEQRSDGHRITALEDQLNGQIAEQIETLRRDIQGMIDKLLEDDLQKMVDNQIEKSEVKMREEVRVVRGDLDQRLRKLEKRTGEMIERADETLTNGFARLNDRMESVTSETRIRMEGFASTIAASAQSMQNAIHDMGELEKDNAALHGRIGRTATELTRISGIVQQHQEALYGDRAKPGARKSVFENLEQLAGSQEATTDLLTQISQDIRLFNGQIKAIEVAFEESRNRTRRMVVAGLKTLFEDYPRGSKMGGVGLAALIGAAIKLIIDSL